MKYLKLEIPELGSARREANNLDKEPRKRAPVKKVPSAGSCFINFRRGTGPTSLNRLTRYILFGQSNTRLLIYD